MGIFTSTASANTVVGVTSTGTSTTLLDWVSIDVSDSAAAAFRLRVGRAVPPVRLPARARGATAGAFGEIEPAAFTSAWTATAVSAASARDGAFLVRGRSVFVLALLARLFGLFSSAGAPESPAFTFGTIQPPVGVFDDLQIPGHMPIAPQFPRAWQNHYLLRAARTRRTPARA